MLLLHRKDGGEGAKNVLFCIFNVIIDTRMRKSLYLCRQKQSIYTAMTTIELRTSIASDLDQMSVEMLENVSRYVKRLQHRSRSLTAQTDASQRRREAAMLFVKNLSVQGGIPVPADEHGISIAVLSPVEFFDQIDSK